MAQQEKTVQDSGRQNPRAMSRAVIALLGFVPAALFGAAVFRYQAALPIIVPIAFQPYLLAVVAGLALFGALAALAWLFGLLRFAADDPDRIFYDSVADALIDPIVVTDDRGRAIYANAPYLKLASRAGLSRLVGFDVLYAGYREFAEPVYQLTQMINEDHAGQRDVRVAAASSAPGASLEEARWLRMTVTPLYGVARRSKAMWRLIDITADRVQQEQAFSRLQFIITYLDQAPVGFFSTLPSGKVDYINATLADWLKLDLTQTQSGKITQTELIGEEGAKILNAISPSAGEHRIDRFQFPVKDAKGETHLFDVINRSDFNLDGTIAPARAMVMKLDASAHAKGPSSVDVAQFLSAAPIGIAEVDEKGALVSANAEFLLLSHQLKLGSSIFDRSHQVFNALFQCAKD